MTNILEIFFKHTWTLFIFVTIINGFILKVRSKKYILEKPELKEGYDKYFKKWLFYGNIPWIIMAFGNISGMTSSIFEYLNPKSMNPIVLIFHGSIIVLWIICIKWIYFRNGAMFIEQHPGLFHKSSLKGENNLTAKDVKIVFPLVLLGGIIGMIIIWVLDIPFSKF